MAFDEPVFTQDTEGEPDDDGENPEEDVGGGAHAEADGIGEFDEPFVE